MFPDIPEWANLAVFALSGIGMIAGVLLLIPPRKKTRENDPPSAQSGISVTMGHGNVVGDIGSKVHVTNDGKR